MTSLLPTDEDDREALARMITDIVDVLIDCPPPPSAYQGADAILAAGFRRSAPSTPLSVTVADIDEAMVVRSLNAYADADGDKQWAKSGAAMRAALVAALTQTHEPGNVGST